MNSPFRILFLTPQLPFPPIGGGSAKSLGMLRHLAERHTVTLACLLKGDDAEHLAAFRSAVPVAGFHGAPLKRSRNIWNALLAGLRGIPLTLWRNHDPGFADWIRNAAGEFDAIFVDHYLMYQYVPKGFSRRVVLHAHNAEHVLWARAAAAQTSILRKVYVAYQARLIRSYERRINYDCDLVLAAPNDQKAFLEIGTPAERLRHTLHLGDESMMSLPLPKFPETDLSLLFVGTLSWEPNSDGLLWFLREVWEDLLLRIPDLRLDIIGGNAPAILRREVSGHKGVHLHGFVEDLEPWYRRARMFVAPLRYGSGTKVKVINAFYRGMAIATTPVGMEGLDCVPDRDMVVSENAGDLAMGIERIVRDEARWNELTSNARKFAADSLRWAPVLAQVEEALIG